MASACTLYSAYDSCFAVPRHQQGHPIRARPQYPSYRPKVKAAIGSILAMSLHPRPFDTSSPLTAPAVLTLSEVLGGRNQYQSAQGSGDFRSLRPT